MAAGLPEVPIGREVPAAPPWAGVQELELSKSDSSLVLLKTKMV